MNSDCSFFNYYESTKSFPITFQWIPFTKQNSQLIESFLYKGELITMGGPHKIPSTNVYSLSLDALFLYDNEKDHSKDPNSVLRLNNPRLSKIEEFG